MKNKKLFFSLLLATGLLFSVAGCNSGSQKNQGNEESTAVRLEQRAELVPEISAAICVLHPTEGNNVSGVVKFRQEGSIIRIVADLEGLEPGLHGFHIHEYGDCSAPDGTSAGGHFNPEDMPHGGPNDAKRHVGDLGNIEADDNGIAHLEMTDSVISFIGKHSIIGRAIIVHAGEDDLVTQPTGNAGARVACGVIGIDE